MSRIDNANATNNMGDVNIQENERERNFRERILAARRASKLDKEAQQEEKSKTVSSADMLKAKLLNLIPGYGPYVAFKQAVLMKKNKFTVVDAMIMLFSNLNGFFIVLGGLVFITFLVVIIAMPLKIILDLLRSGMQAIIDLFQ